jgi:hypothetical protein
MEKRNSAMGAFSGTAFNHPGSLPLELPDGCIQVLHFETEMIDGALLPPYNAGHGIIAFIRPGVMEQLDFDIPDGQKCYLKVYIFILLDLRTPDPEALEFFYGQAEIFHHDSDVPQFLEHDVT